MSDTTPVITISAADDRSVIPPLHAPAPTRSSRPQSPSGMRTPAKLPSVSSPLLQRKLQDELPSAATSAPRRVIPPIVQSDSSSVHHTPIFHPAPPSTPHTTPSNGPHAPPHSALGSGSELPGMHPASLAARQQRTDSKERVFPVNAAMRQASKPNLIVSEAAPVPTPPRGNPTSTPTRSRNMSLVTSGNSSSSVVALTPPVSPNGLSRPQSGNVLTSPSSSRRSLSRPNSSVAHRPQVPIPSALADSAVQALEVALALFLPDHATQDDFSEATNRNIARSSLVYELRRLRGFDQFPAETLKQLGREELHAALTGLESAMLFMNTGDVSSSMLKNISSLLTRAQKDAAAAIQACPDGISRLLALKAAVSSAYHLQSSEDAKTRSITHFHSFVTRENLVAAFEQDDDASRMVLKAVANLYRVLALQQPTALNTQLIAVLNSEASRCPFHPLWDFIDWEKPPVILQSFATGSSTILAEATSELRAVNQIVSSNNQLFAACGDASIDVWDISGNFPVYHECLRQHDGAVLCLAVEDDLMLSGSLDKSIGVWRQVTQLKPKTPAAPVDTPGDSSGSSSDLLSQPSALTELKSVRTWQLVDQLLGHSGWIRALVMDTNRERAYSGSGDETVRVWSLTTWLCVHTIRYHQNWIWTLSLHADKLFVGSRDKTISVWNVSTASPVREGTLIGHSNWIRSVDVVNNHLVSGSCDGTLRVWSLAGTPSETSCVAVLDAECGRILTISHQDNRVFVGSEDCMTRMYDLTDPMRPQMLRMIHDSYRRVRQPVASICIANNRLFSAANVVKMWS